MFDIITLQNFCSNPSKELLSKLQPNTQQFLTKITLWCLENEKGNLITAHAISKIIDINYKGIYLTTDQRKTLAKNINGFFKGIKAKQCINGASESLLKYLTTEKFIGKGTFGNVYIGCTPPKDCKYKFAIKLARVDKNAIKKPYNPNNNFWHEYFILHDIIKDIIDKNICPNLPYLIDTFICEECNFTFHGYGGKQFLTQKDLEKGSRDYKQKKPCIIYIMELATGNDFNTWMQNPHKRTEPELYNALFQLMAGIHAIQIHGQVSNNDIKALNILTYNVTPGGYWKYIIQGQEYYIPNLGQLFIVNDFGVSAVFSPKFCLKTTSSAKCKMIGARMAIIDGKYSILEGHSAYDIDCKPFDAVKRPTIIGAKSTRPKKFKPNQPTQRHDCTYLNITQSGITPYNITINCNASEYKVLPTKITLTQHQKDKLTQYGLPINPNSKEFYEQPDIIPPASKFRIDTQDCIRIFTGGNRYTQPGKHTVFDCVTEKIKTELSNYIINPDVESSGMITTSLICSGNFISPEYDMAGYFINHFFPKYYPNFSKNPGETPIEIFNISPKLPWM